MSKLLAFDQALNCSGYAVYIDGSLSDYGKFSTTEGASVPQRLKELRDTVNGMLDKISPDAVAIEEIQLQQIPGTSAHGNVETFKKLAYVQAVILEILEENNIPCSIIPSSSWKSTCGVRGRARAEQKRNAQAYVLKEFGVKAIQDTCDAICIGKHVIEEQDKEINWE